LTWYVPYDHDVTIFWFAVFALGCARATRLARVDRIFQRPRRALIIRYGEGSAMAYFLTCPWCISIWLAPLFAWGFLLTIHARGPQWWLMVPLTLAYSYLAGLLSRLEGD
jgi:hypothetical protein